MSSSLTLKYVIQLASNISQQVRVDEAAITQSQTRIQQTVKKTNDQFYDMGVAISKSGGEVEKLRREIDKLGNNTSTQRQINYMEQLGRVVDRVHERTQRLHQTIREGAANLVDKAPQVAAGGYAATRVLAAPVKAYANLEQAQTDLRAAMTDSKGGVDKNFKAVSAEAIRLGSRLPGTTKDFAISALALKTNGTPSDVIANGGLRASAYLGVLLKDQLDQRRAAEMVAQTREAYGLSGPELVKAADLVQRAYYGFGVKPESILAANTYMTQTLTSRGVGWGGVDRMREVLAIQGIASQKGIQGSVFGTDMKDFLTRLAMLPTRLNKHSAEARHAREVMTRYGISDFNPFGPDGKMVSPVQLVEKMQAFNRIDARDQIPLFHQMFGEQGGQTAQLLASITPEQMQHALNLQDSQSSLDQKLDIVLDTLSNKFENATGNLENFSAALGKTIEGPLKKLLDRSADFIGGPATDFVNAHPVASGAGWLGASAGAGYLGYKSLGSLATWLRGGSAAAEAAAGGGAASSVGGLGAASRLGIYAAGAWGAYQIGRLGFALNDLYDVNHREGVQLTPEARGRVQYLNRDRDWLSMTSPQGQAQDGAAHLVPTVQVGQGVLKVELHVSDDRVSATAVPFKDMPLLRIDSGHTNPGGY